MRQEEITETNVKKKIIKKIHLIPFTTSRPRVPTLIVMSMYCSITLGQTILPLNKTARIFTDI